MTVTLPVSAVSDLIPKPAILALRTIEGANPQFPMSPRLDSQSLPMVQSMVQDHS
jgi:hypothetical protein